MTQRINYWDGWMKIEQVHTVRLDLFTSYTNWWLVLYLEKVTTPCRSASCVWVGEWFQWVSYMGFSVRHPSSRFSSDVYKEKSNMLQKF